ncbi:MAG: SpoVR family protein [Planctomycetes bacterium]|nr:SpoVR family protein [Planctomycetota bacterium]
MTLTPELRALKEEIETHARAYGLDFFETHFEMIDFEDMNEIAAYGGFPIRYPHWRHGMVFEQHAKGYAYGLQKIFELVINNDPCYAYLMRANSTLDQKMVMAHVYGHSDFFKTNLWFGTTNRRMIDQMANHGVRVRRHIERVGLETVETFIDRCLSVENLIDLHHPYVVARAAPHATDPARAAVDPPPVPRPGAKDYMDRYLNPPELLAKERARRRAETTREPRCPAAPTRDVLGFLLEHAPLKDWQRDLLGIVRAEALYFAPQAMTRIMNEGWASYWHSTLMTEKMLRDDELIDYAETHAATMGVQPGQLNPYKLGLELWRDIEDRWDRGRHGPDYERCDDMERKRSWDTGARQGRTKIFEVRKVMHDVSFVDAFVTEEFAQKHHLFVYQKNPRSGRVEITSRDFRRIKEELLFRMTNLGNPIVEVMDMNHMNRGELYLVHRWEGRDLKFDEALETLLNLRALWKRPVHLETKEDGRGKLLSCDAERVEVQDILPTLSD